MTTYIIEDELAGREILNNFLAKYCPIVTVVGQSATVKGAVSEIAALNPQLILLDINLNSESGFDLFKHFTNPSFYTIFITAHQSFAIQAIKHQAVDYLLKPINIDDLIAATIKVQQLIDAKDQAGHIGGILSILKTQSKQAKIKLPVLDGFVYVTINDIIRCEADGNYTQFHFCDKPKLIVCKTLGNFEKTLHDFGFVRVHNHHLINSAHIVRYQRGRGGIVHMSDKSEVDVSQRKKDELLMFLQQIIS